MNRKPGESKWQRAEDNKQDTLCYLRKKNLQLVNIYTSSQNMEASSCSDGTYYDYDLHYIVPSIKRPGKKQKTKGYSWW